MGRKLWGAYQVSAVWLFTALFCILVSLFFILTFGLVSRALASRFLRIYGVIACWLSRVEVITEGAESVEVYLPAGRWIHLWTGAGFGSQQAGRWIEVDAPIGSPAVFRDRSRQSMIPGCIIR